MKLERGQVLLVHLDPTVGHEQRGVRPAVLVSDPEVIEHQRFTLLCIVPMTTTRGEGALYPKLEPGQSGLRQASYAMVDQLRSVDKRRVRRIYGKLTGAAMAAVDQGLRLFLDLE